MATSTTIYLIDNTDGSLTFAIQPRTVDGPGGVQQNTDLTMYGNGAPGWGERFNENFYHLTENFATAQQTKGDPTDPTVPKTDTLLAGTTGTLGINDPIEGQTWHNKTTNQLFSFDAATWRNVADLISNGPPGSRVVNPVMGQMYYNTTSQHVEVYDTNEVDWIDPLALGTSGFLPMDGSGAMTGALVLDDGGVAISGTATEILYVSREGDTMGGRLIISDSDDGVGLSIITVGEHLTSIGPAIQQSMFDEDDVEYTDVSGTLYQPVYETYTPKNNGNLTGAVETDSRGVFRLASPPGLAFDLQLDGEFKGGGDLFSDLSIDHVLHATNGGAFSGILTFEGTPSTGTNWGTVHCPNATLGNITAASVDVLTTKEYVTSAVASASSVIPQFVNKAIFRNTGGTIGWTSVDATSITGGAVPRDAVAVIIEHTFWLNGPDVVDLSQVRIRAPSQSGNSTQWFIVQAGLSAGADDVVGGGGQGTYPIENGIFQYTIESPGYSDFDMAVMGYFGAS